MQTTLYFSCVDDDRKIRVEITGPPEEVEYITRAVRREIGDWNIPWVEN